MKKHYVYITTNLINRKQYVGDHSTDNLNVSYLGSGSILHKAINKYKKGTGRGLSLVKRIIDVHKGKISVKSSLNRGSTFSFILPKENVAKN